MKKWPFLIFPILIIPSLSGCVNTNLNTLNSGNIQRGDSQKIVQSKMGKPQLIEEKGDQLAWQYCSTNTITHRQNYYVILFRKGAVTTKPYTYSFIKEGDCTSHFTPIKFLQQ